RSSRFTTQSENMTEPVMKMKTPKTPKKVVVYGEPEINTIDLDTPIDRFPMVEFQLKMFQENGTVLYSTLFVTEEMLFDPEGFQWAVQRVVKKLQERLQ